MRAIPLLLAFALCIFAILTGRARADLFISGWSGGNPTIGRYEETTGAFLGYLAGSGELPAGLGVGPDHQLYVTGDVFGAGQLYRATGATTGTIVGPTFVPPLTPDHGWTYPLGATFGPDGSLYVTSNYNSAYPSATNGILKYSTNGTYLGKFAETPASYVTFAPNGDVLVNTTYSAAGAILRYRGSDGAPLGTFVAIGSGGLATPGGIAFGPDGNFYVGDWPNKRVLRYDGTTGAFIDVFVASASGGLQGPNDLTFGPDGNLYAGSSLSVLRYNGTTGAFINAFVPSNLPFQQGQIQPRFMSFGTVPEPASIALAVVPLFALVARPFKRSLSGERCKPV